MVLRALDTGVSGLRAESEAIGVVGDNIANVNTVGFKGQRVLFEDVLGRSVVAGNSGGDAGAGVKVGGVQQLFTQGALGSTGVSTDVALNGDGFFVVKGNVAGVSGNFYTRAGQFNIDASGKLVNPDGLEVQGYAANPDGTYAASLSTLKVPTSAISPQATTSMSVTANLDSQATTPAAAWDPQNPSSTSNFSTSMSVYDSLGKAHSVDVYFVKTGSNSWNYHAIASGDEVNPAQPGKNVEIGSGSLAFDTSGALNTVTTTTPISVDFANAKPGQAISLDFGTPVSGGGTGLDGITQFASTSNVSAQSQNGYASGDLASVSIDGQGVVNGVYTNGKKIPVGQLAVAKFASNEGLGRAGQGLWIETRDSGTAAMGTASSGGRGSVSSGSLEGSNVDIADQFVELIQHQRAYSANSRTITTADEMLQEVLNLKR